MCSELIQIFDALAQVYQRENRPGGDAAAQALRAAGNAELETSGYHAAPWSLLEAASGQEAALPLAGAILGCCDRLYWRHWAEGALDDEVSSNLYSTELVGPDGLFFDAGVRVGLLVSAAQTDYPVSSHSGEETCWVISGVADWTLDDGLYRPVRPGSLVHHPAWMPHGRRTGREVFLGAWRWSGDLDLDSFRVADGAGSAA